MKVTSKNKITDAHMHIPVNYRTFAEKKTALLNTMKINSVSKGVVISDSEPISDIGSLRECVNLFEDTPNIAVVGGISPFINCNEQLRLLESCVISQKIVGIKLYCGHEPFYISDKILKPIYELAEKYDVPVLFHSGWENPQYTSPEIIQQTAQAYPDIKLICCHCCYPNLSACFNALAEYANVYFDISSVAEADIEDVKPALERAVNTMPERIIFGSDYACCSQEKHIELCNKLDISDHEKQQLLYENAEKIYFRS